MDDLYYYNVWFFCRRASVPRSQGGECLRLLEAGGSWPSLERRHPVLRTTDPRKGQIGKGRETRTRQERRIGIPTGEIKEHLIVNTCRTLAHKVYCFSLQTHPKVVIPAEPQRPKKKQAYSVYGSPDINYSRFYDEPPQNDGNSLNEIFGREIFNSPAESRYGQTRYIKKDCVYACVKLLFPNSYTTCTYSCL